MAEENTEKTEKKPEEKKPEVQTFRPSSHFINIRTPGACGRL